MDNLVSTFAYLLKNSMYLFSIDIQLDGNKDNPLET